MENEQVVVEQENPIVEQREEEFDTVEDAVRASIVELGGEETRKEHLELKEELEKGSKRQTYEKDELDVPKTKRERQRDGKFAKTGEGEIEPPERFPVDKKEFFNKLPRELKEEIKRNWGDLEGHTTKIWQDLQREKGRYENVNRLVDTYLPKWGVNGLTPDAAIAELCAFQDLAAKDPHGAIDLLMQRTGVTLDDYLAYADTGRKPVQQQQPQNNVLTEERIREILQEHSQSQQYQQAYNSDFEQLKAVQNARSGDGVTYLYPELHDPAQISSVQSFVEALRKTQPSLPIAQATTKAIELFRASNGSPSLQPQATKLPNNQEIANRMKAASVSVLGRGNARLPSTLGNAAPDESVEDSLRLVMASLNQGTGY